jgi:succinyl-CoA synthetase beta subunit
MDIEKVSAETPDKIVTNKIELKDEGLFNSTANDFVLVFYATDSEERQNELKWIKELNKEALFKEYENWMKTWDV